MLFPKVTADGFRDCVVLTYVGDCNLAKDVGDCCLVPDDLVTVI